MKKTVIVFVLTLLAGAILSSCNTETKETYFEPPSTEENIDATDISENKDPKFTGNIPSAKNIKEGATIETLNNAAANDLFKKGIEFAQNEEYEKALEMFDNALELVEGENRIKVLSNKASMFYNLKDYEKALEVYEEIIQLAPENAENYSNKGATLLKLGQYQEAIKLYDLSLQKQEEDNFPAVYNKACAYALLEIKDEALQNLEKAIEIRPEAKEFAKQDEDLSSLWNMPKFQELTKQDPEAEAETEKTENDVPQEMTEANDEEAQE